MLEVHVVLLASHPKSHVSWSTRSFKALFQCALNFFLTFEIHKFISKPLNLPSFHKTTGRLSENLWHERLSRALAPIFFFSNGELNKKKKRQNNNQQTEEVGLSSFLSPGYSAFLFTLKGCQINVFPTESQAFTGNSRVCMKIILTIFCLYTVLFHARISTHFIK